MQGCADVQSLLLRLELKMAEFSDRKGSTSAVQLGAVLPKRVPPYLFSGTNEASHHNREQGHSR